MVVSGNPQLVGAFEAQRRRMLLRGRAQALITLLLLSTLLVLSAWTSDFLSGDYGAAPLARLATFLARMNPHLAPAALLDGSATQGSIAYWFYAFPKWARALLTSIEMALLATAVSVVLAFAFALSMTRTVTRNRIVRQAARLVPNLLRTMPSFIVAMLLVQLVGTGPVAGTLALIVACFAGLARPFSEIMDNADTGPMESVRAAGGGRLAQIRYGLVPLIAPNLLTYAFVWVEVNVSASTALGIVGAGGIGQELAGALAYNQFDSYLAMILMIAAVVVAADLTSEQVRHRLFGLGAERRR